LTNICVIGLGRIGFPLALLLAKANHRVIGVDKNQVALKRHCKNTLKGSNGDIEQSLLKKYLNSRLFISEDLQSALSKSNIVFIAIGTGVGSDGSPDLSNLFDLVKELYSEPENVREKLFIFKSTLPVGTTRKIANILEEKTEMANSLTEKSTHVVLVVTSELDQKRTYEKIINEIDKYL
jgi:UDPglucose 6-dehydrogenase